MKTEIVTLLIFNVWVPPSRAYICTDVKNLPHLANNIFKGSPFLSKRTGGFFHCVDTCKMRARCKGFKYNPFANLCNLHARVKYSSKAANDRLLSSAIADWTKQITYVLKKPGKAKLQRGYDCYMMIGQRAFYNGTTNVTKSGINCQKWTDLFPQVHTTGRKANEFATGETMDEISNRCRVPITDSNNKPWCYTEKYGVRLEDCDVPLCPPENY